MPTSSASTLPCVKAPVAWRHWLIKMILNQFLSFYSQIVQIYNFLVYKHAVSLYQLLPLAESRAKVENDWKICKVVGKPGSQSHEQHKILQSQHILCHKGAQILRLNHFCQVDSFTACSFIVLMKVFLRLKNAYVFSISWIPCYLTVCSHLTFQIVG